MRLWPIWDFHFGYLFANTTTNGGDMGAHVWWPWYLEHHWFPKLRLSGWSPDWYAGFPVGHYYFPFPALLIALLDKIPFVPYNVAFKLVTVSGPLLLPASAYTFARAAGTMARAACVRDRRDRHARADAQRLADLRRQHREHARGRVLLHARARARPVRARRARQDARHRQATMAARGVDRGSASMSHVVVAMVLGLFAVLLFVTRRPGRTWRLALPIGAVAVALTAVWSLPLIARNDMTQSMRYQKLVPGGGWRLWGWVRGAPAPVEHTIEGVVRGIGDRQTAAGDSVKQPLWLPWWIWLLAGIAIVAAGFYRRRSTLVLLVARARCSA